MSGTSVRALGEPRAVEPPSDLLGDASLLARVRERLVTSLDPQVLDPFSPVPDRTARIEAVIHSELSEISPPRSTRSGCGSASLRRVGRARSARDVDGR